MILIRGVLGAILAITAAVGASPYEFLDVRSSNLRTRALDTHNCVDFGTGAPNGYHSFGDVCVDITTTSVTVTFPTLPTGDTYEEAHLYLGTVAPTNRNPGGFPYNSFCTVSGATASCTVPLSALTFGPLGCNQKLYIAAHAVVAGTISPGTGWGNIGGQTTFDCPNQNANCAKYWTFYTSCQCPVVTTFAPVTCTSTTTSTTEFVTQPTPVTSGSTTCNDPGPLATVTVDGGVGTCPPCAAPTYFCGCS